MNSRILHLLLPLMTLGLVSTTPAATINVREGSVIFDFDPVALAALNVGSDPAIGGMILEEFFQGNADRNRTRAQILSDHIVPTFSAIPTTYLKYEINGSTVTNLAGRTRKVSTFSYDPANVTGTALGEIGLTGVLRFVGDFTGVFLLGDFTFRYNLPAGNTLPNRGWVFVNNFDFPGVPAFETKNVVVTASAGKLVIAGDLTISYEMDQFFLPGDRGKDVGEFRVETPIAAITPPRTPAASSFTADSMRIEVIGKGNASYQLQYSTDLLNWITVGPKVTGKEQLIQWTDAGPPLTPTAPSSTERRFYRLLEE